MKNLICILVIISLSSVSLMASNSPSPVDNLFTIEAISFEINAEQMNEHNLDIEFNESDNTLIINAGNEISFVQVIKKNGELEYQIPLFSKNIVLDLNDFDKGSFNLNLLMGQGNMINSSFIR